MNKSTGETIGGLAVMAVLIVGIIAATIIFTPRKHEECESCDKLGHMEDMIKVPRNEVSGRTNAYVSHIGSKHVWFHDKCSPVRFRPSEWIVKQGRERYQRSHNPIRMWFNTDGTITREGNTTNVNSIVACCE